MHVFLNSTIRIDEVPTTILSEVKKELTMKNPAYIKKRAMGIPLWGTPPEFKLYTETAEGLILPRGYCRRLWELAGKNIILADSRVLCDKVVFPMKPNLRDYQSPAVNVAKMRQQGIIVMPCGAGKTETGLGIIADIGQPTLWITHTMDLLNQSMERAKFRLGLKGKQIGIIQGDNFSIGTHITFATVQTLDNRNLSEISKRFGLAMIDESHLCFRDEKSERMFNNVISQLPAFYRYGLTASEHRSDGLVNTMYHIIGPKLYEIEQDDPRLPTVKPRVEFIESNFEYLMPEDEEGNKERLNVKSMVREMVDDDQRNSIIMDVLKNKISEKDFCLVLGESLEHLQYLKSYTDGLSRPSAFVCGTTPKREREKIMSDMRAGKYQYLYATYQLAKLGLDIPILSKLVQATPVKDRTSIQQAVGRIMRPEEGKELPVVFDFWDIKTPQLKFWGNERAKVYKKLGCEVIGGPKVRGR